MKWKSVAGQIVAGIVMPFGLAAMGPVRADDGAGNVQYVPIPTASPSRGGVVDPGPAINPPASDGQAGSAAGQGQARPPVVYVPNPYAYTYGSPPPVVYAAPPPVYYAPPRVYYAPPPVYIAPAPMIVEPYYFRPHYGFSFSHFGRRNGFGFGIGF